MYIKMIKSLSLFPHSAVSWKSAFILFLPQTLSSEYCLALQLASYIVQMYSGQTVSENECIIHFVWKL